MNGLTLALQQGITPETTISLTLVQALLLLGTSGTFVYYATTVLLMLRSHHNWIKSHDEQYGPMARPHASKQRSRTGS